MGNLVRDMIDASPNRRSFVRKLGLASAVAGAVAMGDKKALAQASVSDLNILNFALNLEYLEAEFYTIATTGQNISQIGLNISGTGTSGNTTGGNQVTFTNPIIQAVAAELAFDEQTHVKLLQQTIASLGGQAIAKPPINLNALGIGFASQAQFLTLARGFEDLGVTAYGGAAPLISSSTILGYAARILATEAMHAGNIRLLLAQNGISVTALDGADHLPPPAGTQYFTTDSNAITEVRTPGQVLYVAFGGQANVIAGGFFPSGVNGSLNTSSAAAATTDGASITASPNPIVTTGTYGQTTITWSAPSSAVVEVRVGSPSGALLSYNDGYATGSVQTGVWVSDGTVFYLQDVSNGKQLTSQNTLASVVVHVT